MAGGILANMRGRLVGSGGQRAGEPGVDGCTCCGCACPAAVQMAECNPGTTPASFLATDAGITAPCGAACLTSPGPIPGPQWYDYTIDSGLAGSTFCLDGGPSVWSSPGGGVSATRKTYSDAACTTLVAVETFGMGWALTRSAGAWRLTLAGNTTDTLTAVAFDATIATVDPIDCCQPLAFTNSIAACGTDSSSFPTLAFLIGVGGAVSITPCCPP